MPTLRQLLHAGKHHDVIHHDDDVSAPECENGDPWIWQNLNQCVEGPQQFAGFVLGIGAIAVWIVIHALLLRLRYEEYLSRKAWSSALVLLHISFPDCLSILGAILTKQLSTQIFMAIYLIMADIGFWVFFALLKIYQNGGFSFFRCKNKDQNFEKDRNMNNLVFVTPFVISFMYLASWFNWNSKWTTWLPLKGGSGMPMMTHRTRILMHAGHEEQTNEYSAVEEFLPKFGYGLGVTAVLFTWSALLHQSEWVFQEKKVPKAYYVIHLFMILSDVLYLTSVFTQSIETDFLLHTLPWTAMRIGTIGLNAGILFQAYLNISQRLAGHEINKDVAMLLRSDGNKDTEDDDDDDDCSPARPLLDVPKKNKYIRKMREIAKQIEKQEKGQSSEDELFSDDEAKPTTTPEPPPSDMELDFDLNDSTLQYELTNEDVYNILAAEDRQGTVVLDSQQKPAVLHVGAASEDEKDSVIYFNETTDAPPTPSPASTPQEIRKNSQNNHKTVFLDDSRASP